MSWLCFGKDRVLHIRGADGWWSGFLIGNVFTYFSFSPKPGSRGDKRKVACECFTSRMGQRKPVSAGAMFSASRGPHPQGDMVESDTPGFDIY